MIFAAVDAPATPIAEDAERDACPRCGGELRGRTGEYLVTCRGCQRQWAPRVNLIYPEPS